MLLQNCVDGGIDAAPLGEQQVEDLSTAGGEEVKTLFALFFLTPLAGQKSLGFQAAQEGIKRAFINLQAVLGEGFAQRVTVLFTAQGRQNRQHQATTAEFEAKVLKGLSGS